MGIRLFDSKEQSLRDFVPLTPGQVGIYVCGPTVQSSPHVGHLRSALVYDQLRRWLTHEGLNVTLIRNVTDIDDKVLENAAASGSEPWWALAYRMETEFTASYDLLGMLRPTYEPRATGHIPEMIALIGRLIDKGHAYPAEDGTADVYFDTASWPAYGELTNQKPADMDSNAEAPARGKKNPQDFALWKASKDEDPDTARWDSPWGEGRPGWHIECSAMSTAYLGPQFDIHGGGLDLRFPHHENELAQSRSAGDDFAQYWLHNGLVSIGGQKMSKSLGNSVFAEDLLAQAEPIVLRYVLGSAHYRSTLELHDGAIAEGKAAFERISSYLGRAHRELGDLASVDVLPAFRDAMNDDLNIPGALAVIFDHIRSGNSALDSKDSSAAQIAAEVLAMVDVLGLNPHSDIWKILNNTSGASSTALEGLMEQLLAERQRAREDKDFATADMLRERLAAAGITIDDTPEGAHWSINGR